MMVNPSPPRAKAGSDMARSERLLSRQEANPLCGKCVRRCRQPLTVLLLECPRFRPFPFKIQVRNYEQLELFSDEESS